MVKNVVVYFYMLNILYCINYSSVSPINSIAFESPALISGISKASATQSHGLLDPPHFKTSFLNLSPLALSNGFSANKCNQTLDAIALSNKYE